MKNILIELFDLEEDEFSLEDVLKAGVSLFVGLGVLFVPLFI